MVNGEQHSGTIHRSPFAIHLFFVDLLNKFGADARQERGPAACGGGAPVAVAERTAAPSAITACPSPAALRPARAARPRGRVRHAPAVRRRRPALRRRPGSSAPRPPPARRRSASSGVPPPNAPLAPHA